MGKKSKDKKKGQGAEKTAAKTEKKLSNKMKKQLQAIGEDDIEAIVAQIEKEEKQRLQVTETAAEPPSRRVNFTFVPHPDKDQLILFGGEFFNGQKTFLYNDLYFYSIAGGTWSLVKAPAGPPPRCAHQMVATSANKGQLWLFGGEFASPTQTQFYHYRDLWVFHVAQKRWEKILAANGPSARSGHRMVLVKKQLIVFGGFHDNLRDYRYFNDVYSFNTETYCWVKLDVGGSAPAPRSGCCMVGLNDGRVLVYGGYSKEKIKKDVDKGRVYTDSFILAPEKNDTTGLKWKWTQLKIGGSHFPPRCSMPVTTTPNNTHAYCFGGVFDVEDDDENISGHFYNNFLQLDLDRFVWRNITVVPKQPKKDEAEESPQQQMEVDDNNRTTAEETTVVDDGIFKVTVGPAPSSTVGNTSQIDDKSLNSFRPSPRINCGLAIKHGVLYLYGGMFEDGDKQITCNDFYSVDLKKLDEWKILIKDDVKNLEWLGSDDSDGSDNDDDDDDDDDEVDDSNSDGDESNNSNDEIMKTE